MSAVESRPHCNVKPRTVRALPPGLPANRLQLIRMLASKWVNGTVLHYFFVGGPEPQRQAVRDGFAEWKGLPIGLEFVEVSDRSEAEVRIGFDQADGSWSYVGRDILGIGASELTMNFGWDLTDDYGHTTALHEIGHTLGLPHEHQNPFAGITWDENKVYAYFTGSPNNWSRDDTFQNVLRKIDSTEVEGSNWDPDSVMEYWFPGGLIVEPAKYQNGLNPAGGLSAIDRTWIKGFYPELKAAMPKLEPYQSKPLTLDPGEQADFRIEPTASRNYQFATFGTADAVLVLFEDVNGELRYLAGDDDSGQERNTSISTKLFQGRKYVARVRLYWSGGSGQAAIMYW